MKVRKLLENPLNFATTEFGLNKSKEQMLKNWSKLITNTSIGLNIFNYVSYRRA